MAKNKPREPEWYSMTATGRLIGCSRVHVHRLVRAGHLEVADIGLGEKRGRPVISKASIDEFMAKRVERVAS